MSIHYLMREVTSLNVHDRRFPRNWSYTILLFQRSSQRMPVSCIHGAQMSSIIHDWDSSASSSITRSDWMLQFKFRCQKFFVCNYLYARWSGKKEGDICFFFTLLNFPTTLMNILWIEMEEISDRRETNSLLIEGIMKTECQCYLGNFM